MIPLDNVVHPEWGESLSRLARGGSQYLISIYAALRRKQKVFAQYDTERLASDYVYAHALSRPEGRHLRSRIRLLHELLSEAPYGKILDAGCGPGVLVQSLLDSTRHDYEITVLDQSQAMVRYCMENTRESGEVRATVGDLEALPFASGTFDITIVTGALEYTDARSAVQQISRVTREGGLVVLSMLHPVNPYRLAEWFFYWPALRVFSATIKALRIRTRRPHGANASGIHALTSLRLRRYARQAGLSPTDVVYFDLTPLIPPLDRIPALARWSERRSGRSAATRGWDRWMATGYILVARRK